MIHALMIWCIPSMLVLALALTPVQAKEIPTALQRCGTQFGLLLIQNDELSAQVDQLTAQVQELKNKLKEAEPKKEKPDG